MDHPVLLCDHYPHRNRPGWQHWLRRWWNIIDPIARVGGRRRRQVLPRGLWRSLVSVLVERRTLEGGRNSLNYYFSLQGHLTGWSKWI